MTELLFVILQEISVQSLIYWFIVGSVNLSLNISICTFAVVYSTHSGSILNHKYWYILCALTLKLNLI